VIHNPHGTMSVKLVTERPFQKTYNPAPNPMARNNPRNVSHFPQIEPKNDVTKEKRYLGE